MNNKGKRNAATKLHLKPATHGPGILSEVAPRTAASPQGPCPVAAFGASAGGLEAFTERLRHLPCGTGMAFVLIQHLDPKQNSYLTELLGKATPLPVLQVQDGMSVEPNHVYVIPPNANLIIAQGVLSLEVREKS